MNTHNDIADQIEWLKSVGIDRMNTKSIIKASKLARAIRVKSGKVINLANEDIVVSLGMAVFEINEKDLNHLFSLFIESLSLNSSEDSTIKTADAVRTS